MDRELGSIPVLISDTLLDVFQSGRWMKSHARAARLKKLAGQPQHLALDEIFAKSFIKVVDFKPGLGHTKRSC